MQFDKPLVPGRLVKRYKRFLADVALDSGEQVTAHCANPGAMTGLADPGIPVWLSTSDDPKRKLKYGLEIVEVDAGRGPARVGINTAHPNRIVEEALDAGAIGELAGYARRRREVRYGTNSRIDILLEDDARPPCYVEIKNVHLVRQAGLAEFPDSVTKRGAKHLTELAAVARSGARAVMLYLVQRGDCDCFSLADDIDPAYAQAFREARSHGVEALCYDCAVEPEAIRLAAPVPFVLPA
ncbi:MAG: DNA/RNA nuclease SfsA [Rhodobiaceae bacterium]|nr:DNA/RNA nuclease SfsA [Rhodobiaceae bacterium]